MKINKITVENIKGIEKFEMTPEKINFFIGKNGCGKTTVIDAIKVALMQKLSSDSLRAGTKKGVITADFSGIGNIERSINSSGKSGCRLNGKTTTAKSISETFYSETGVSETTGVLMTSGGVMQKLISDDFCEYLLTEKFLKNDVDIDKIISFCIGISTEEEKYLRTIFPASPDVITLEDISTKYSQVETLLKSKNSELKIFKTKSIKPSIVVTDLSEVQEEYDKVCAELSIIAKEELAYKKEALKIKEIGIKIQEIEDNPILKTIPINKAKFEELKKILKLIQNNIRTQEKAQAILEDNLEYTKKVFRNLGNPVCPISKKLICTTDKTAINKEVSDFLTETENKLNGLKEEKEKIVKKESLAIKSIEKIEKQDKLYQQRLILEERLKSLKEIKLMELCPVDEEEKAKLLIQKQELAEKVALAKEYQVALANEGFAKKSKKQIAFLERVSSFISPVGGVRQAVLKHNLGVLETCCNTFTSSLIPKYQIFFDITKKGFGVFLKNSDGNLIEFSALSMGEKLKVSFIMSEMLNQLNGYKILILDNLDCLDKEGLESLLEVLCSKKVSDSFDHIFLASVNNTDVKDAVSKMKINTIEM